jgi:hypothetical protein
VTVLLLELLHKGFIKGVHCRVGVGLTVLNSIKLACGAIGGVRGREPCAMMRSRLTTSLLIVGRS